MPRKARKNAKKKRTKAAGGSTSVAKAVKKAVTKALIGPVRRKIGPKMRNGNFMSGSKANIASYEHKASMPIVKQASYGTGAPQFNGGRPFVVRHREYLQQIINVTTFTGAGRYIIQPGLVDNFPWLSQIAQSFEQYRFKKLKYIYRNRCTTTTNGAIYMAVQYDPSDPEFASIDDIMDYAGARSEVVWRDWSYDAMLKRGSILSKYFVRTDSLPSGLDPQTFDMGLFTICAVSTSGSAGVITGDLLVEYEVEFMNPKKNPNLLGACGFSVNDGFTDEKNVAAYPLGMPSDPPSVTFNNFGSAQAVEIKVEGGQQGLNLTEPGAYQVTYQAVHDSKETLAWSVVNWFSDGVSCVMNTAAMSQYNDGVLKHVSVTAFVLTTAIDCFIWPAFTGVSGTGGILPAAEIVPIANNYLLNLLGLGPTNPSPYFIATSKSLDYVERKFSKVRGCVGFVAKMRKRLKANDQKEGKHEIPPGLEKPVRRRLLSEDLIDSESDHRTSSRDKPRVVVKSAFVGRREE